VPKGCTEGFCHFWHLITLGFASAHKKKGRGEKPRPSCCALRPYGVYLILSYAVDDTLPARSLNCTYTVLVPAPLLSVHDLLVA
jgi:hypothetical protein